MKGTFRLTRDYSIKSLIGIVVVTIALVTFYHSIAINNLKKQETNFNVALTQSLSETIWPEFSNFINNASTLSLEELKASPEINKLRKTIADKVRGLRVVKVKIYNNHALTVFSSDPTQIGESKKDNVGFLTAISGIPTSELVFKREFSTFEKHVEDINVVSSYVPVRKAESDVVEGVFEIYADVTNLVDDIDQTGYTILGGVVSLLFALYIFLFMTVRRADAIIRAHDEAVHQHQLEKITKLANFDILTELSNRSRFVELLTVEINNNSAIGVLYLSLDRFKLINESMGHENADRILVEFAQRFRSIIAENGCVARMGGDEFALFLSGQQTEKSIILLAEKLIDMSNLPFSIAGKEIIITLSIGVTIQANNNMDAEHLIENAIAAMHKTKENGRNSYLLYSIELNHKSRERLEMEQDLRKALTNNQYVLHYQPRVDAGSGEVKGLEALLRWQHPSRGLVPPMEFIYLLEELDLMVPVGDWILNESCRQLKIWHNAGYEDLCVSVNLSLRQFRSDSLIETVAQTIEKNEIPGHCLELELTESVLADDAEQATRMLHALRDLGVIISMDDFGTGYSSLSYLMQFPIDCLKIDRSFITNVTTDKQNVLLTSAIIAMAKSLQLITVAEGVETAEQYHLLNSLDCNEIQGFWFSKPLPAKDIPDALFNIPKLVLNENTPLIRAN